MKYYREATVSSIVYSIIPTSNVLSFGISGLSGETLYIILQYSVSADPWRWVVSDLGCGADTRQFQDRDTVAVLGPGQLGLTMMLLPLLALISR